MSKIFHSSCSFINCSDYLLYIHCMLRATENAWLDRSDGCSSFFLFFFFFYGFRCMCLFFMEIKIEIWLLLGECLVIYHFLRSRCLCTNYCNNELCLKLFFFLSFCLFVFCFCLCSLLITSIQFVLLYISKREKFE